jgi:two-component system phosphate regulon sensor histidine kinase PhoR
MTRLSGIVDSLITLSRMDSLWGKRSHAAVDLGELASETIEQISLLAEEKQIAVASGRSLPVIVAGDRDRLKQVMVNLIDNAIKYTPAGGSIMVRTSAHGDSAILEVEDTGIGISAEQQGRIFDRFYRVSTDRGEEGAGLGLAIVKAICHAHGGSISVRSAPRQGSCFRVELPLQSAALTGSPESPENRVAAAGAAAATHSSF